MYPRRTQEMIVLQGLFAIPDQPVAETFPWMFVSWPLGTVDNDSPAIERVDSPMKNGGFP